MSNNRSYSINKNKFVIFKIIDFNYFIYVKFCKNIYWYFSGIIVFRIKSIFFVWEVREM